jgi:hypothetical protein
LTEKLILKYEKKKKCEIFKVHREQKKNKINFLLFPSNTQDIKLKNLSIFFSYIYIFKKIIIISKYIKNKTEREKKYRKFVCIC